MAKRLDRKAIRQFEDSYRKEVMLPFKYKKGEFSETVHRLAVKAFSTWADKLTVLYTKERNGRL